MLLPRHVLMALALSLLPVGCGPIGCAGADPEQDLTESEAWVGTAPQELPAPAPQSIYGTWKGEIKDGYTFTLVLMSDGRFHRAQVHAACTSGDCASLVADGKYTLYKRDARTFIELKSTSTHALERYEYVHALETIRIRHLKPGSEWFSLQHSSIAWCGADADCKVQSLPIGPCAGDFACRTNTCAWACGTAPAPM